MAECILQKTATAVFPAPHGRDFVTNCLNEQNKERMLCDFQGKRPCSFQLALYVVMLPCCEEAQTAHMSGG